MIPGNNEVGLTFQSASKENIIGRIFGNLRNYNFPGSYGSNMKYSQYHLLHFLNGHISLLQEFNDTWISNYSGDFMNNWRRNYKSDFIRQNKFQQFCRGAPRRKNTTQENIGVEDYLNHVVSTYYLFALP